MLENIKIELGGIVVNPGEVLVIVLREDTRVAPDEIAKALGDVGLEGRAVVLVADAQLATVPRET